MNVAGTLRLECFELDLVRRWELFIRLKWSFTASLRCAKQSGTVFLWSASVSSQIPTKVDRGYFGTIRASCSVALCHKLMPLKPRHVTLPCVRMWRPSSCKRVLSSVTSVAIPTSLPTPVGAALVGGHPIACMCCGESCMCWGASCMLGHAYHTARTCWAMHTHTH